MMCFVPLILLEVLFRNHRDFRNRCAIILITAPPDWILYLINCCQWNALVYLLPE